MKVHPRSRRQIQHGSGLRQENYPFGGSGNLLNFCKGLAKLPPQPTVIVVFDNDEAGCSALEQAKQLALPPSLRPMRLPDLDSFRSFKTIGPTGSHNADINGCGAAIECYLDLTYDSRDEPVVRWGACSPKSGRYQGVLENKERYAKTFFALRDPKGYDMSKLRAVVDVILAMCRRAP